MKPLPISNTSKVSVAGLIGRTRQVVPAPWRRLIWLVAAVGCLSPGAFKSHAQGTLTNGLAHTGTIAVPSATDTWTIAAKKGDHLSLQIAEQTGGAGFSPRIEIFSPDGATLGAKAAAAAGRVDIQAATSGTFTVAVTDNARTGTGGYRLQFAQFPGPFLIPPGDEGGTLTNGFIHTGTIDQGDLDPWTVEAQPGERIVLQAAKLSGGAGFTPMIELFGPDGTRLGVDSNLVAVRLDVEAPVAGTYSVLISDATQTGSGSYQLQLAKAPGGFVVPAGDEGGALADGVDVDAAIPVGDLDRWSFTASPGDEISLQVSERTGGAGFTPQIELIDPNGARKAVAQNATLAKLDVAVETGGTYSVLVSDATHVGSGTYRLHLTRGSIGPAAANVLTNGISHLGTIGAPGVTNFWSFTASAGESFVVSIGETALSNLLPWVRVFGPTDALLVQDFNAAAAAVSFRATVSGTYKVAVADGSSAHNQTGTYRISLAKTGSPVVISALDEGGTLVNGVSYLASIETGDIDAWTFTGNAGESVAVRVGELNTGSTLIPFLRLYGPDGSLIAQNFQASAAEVAAQLTQSGTFLVVVGDGTAGSNGVGNYRIRMAKTGSLPVIAGTDEGGSLVNGVSYLGSIETGGLTPWTFTANAGENIVVRAGELEPGSPLLPWLRLYGPDGTLLDQEFQATAVEVSTRATQSGTFLVVMADGTTARSGTGNYRISLAKTGELPTISAADEGGPMLNGPSYPGRIDVGDIDAWTFSATAGDNIVVRMGETVTPSTFVPSLRLYSPSGVLLDSSALASAAEVTARATNSGTYLVVVSDGNAGRSGFGDYRISLAKTGSPVTISASDEGGPMINGTTYLGTILMGDVDAWTFTAAAGESLVVRMGETGTEGSLLPWLRLYGPTGVLLDEDFNAAAAEVATRATNSGTYTLVVADGNSGRNGTGNYRISLAKTGGLMAISPGDEGGALENGLTYLAAIETGDVDAWTFTAAVGDSIVVRMGETVANSGLLPWLRLYSPNGVLLDASFNAAAAEVAVRATNSGTFMVVAADGNSARGGTGNYRINLAKTGSPLAITAGDEGGAMVNGTTYLGSIDTGDLDAWTFPVVAGENVVVRMGEVTAGSPLVPWLRLYGPDGALLEQDFRAGAAEVTFRATLSGPMLVVVTDGTSGLGGTGNYRVNLVKTGTPLVTSPGDEGGRLTGAGTYDGDLTVGDLDAWVFTACAGDLISASVTELVANSPLTPWVRLYGRDGALLRSFFGVTTAGFANYVAPANGTYTLVVSDASGGFGASGTYRLTVNGLAERLILCPVAINGPNATLVGIGGTPGAPYTLLTTTRVDAPLNEWVPLVSGQFDQYGVLSVTRPYDPAEAYRFFALKFP